jgi:VCBS repeat-containing protein
VGDIGARETDTIVIELEAWDDDGDEMSFAIDDGRFVQDENMFTWETTYDDAGEHLVTVSVSDGTDTVSQEVAITIENVNRAPIILDIIQK